MDVKLGMLVHTKERFLDQKVKGKRSNWTKVYILSPQYLENLSLTDFKLGILVHPET
jgi:hypothetical protein